MENVLGITRRQAVNLIYKTGGKIFKAYFVKRTNGELRKMICRLGVKKYLKGGPRAYDPKEYKLITVFDLAKKAYRNISIEGLVELKIGGVTYKIIDKEG